MPFNKIDSMLPCICSVIDHRWRKNVVHKAIAKYVTDVLATFW